METGQSSLADPDDGNESNASLLDGPSPRLQNLVHQVPYGWDGAINFIFDDKNYEPQYFTYEGLRRCARCHLLWSSDQHRCSDPVGACGDRCDECWMPVPRGAAGKKQLERHGGACRGQDVRPAWEPSWDGTLHCPLCRCPGFTVEKMKLHLGKGEAGCRGRRRDVLGGGLLPKGYDRRSMRTCDECGFTFHPSVIAMHVCGSTYDPVWLGQTSIPDMTKPYVVWCRDLPAPHGPCGLGGGHIGSDTRGQIPDGLYESSWHVPYSTNLRYATGPVNTFFDLARELARLVNSLGDGTCEDDTPDDDGELRSEFDIDALAAQVKGMSPDEKVQRLREECRAARKEKNRRILSAKNIRPKDFRPGQCQGIGWRHGFVPCPSGATIDLDTAVLGTSDSSGKVCWALLCAECQRIQAAIHSWVSRGKYNADGTRLCPTNSCRGPVSNGVECEQHSRLRGARRMEAKKARLRARDTQAPGRNSRRIWRILSPGDMQSFLSALRQLPSCPWAADETWSGVAEALCGRPAARDVFLVDTETIIIKHEPKVLELAILGADGRLAFTSTIDHGLTVSELCEGVGQQFLGYAIGIYRKDGTQQAHGLQPTHGTTPAQTAQELAKLGLGHGGAVLIEWSENGWDWRALRSLCGAESLPPTYLRAEDIFRKCGYQGPMDLETLYYLCFPGGPLREKHHRAVWDVEKLYQVVRCLLGAR